MNEKLRKIAESFPEFKKYGGATDDEGVLTPEEIEELLESEDGEDNK